MRNLSFKTVLRDICDGMAIIMFKYVKIALKLHIDTSFQFYISSMIDANVHTMEGCGAEAGKLGY